MLTTHLRITWLNGRALVFGTKGCGFESRRDYLFALLHVWIYRSTGPIGNSLHPWWAWGSYKAINTFRRNFWPCIDLEILLRLAFVRSDRSFCIEKPWTRISLNGNEITHGFGPARNCFLTALCCSSAVVEIVAVLVGNSVITTTVVKNRTVSRFLDLSISQF